MPDMAFPTYSSANPTVSQGYYDDRFSAQNFDNVNYWSLELSNNTFLSQR